MWHEVCLLKALVVLEFVLGWDVWLVADKTPATGQVALHGLMALLEALANYDVSLTMLKDTVTVVVLVHGRRPSRGSNVLLLLMSCG